MTCSCGGCTGILCAAPRQGLAAQRPGPTSQQGVGHCACWRHCHSRRGQRRWAAGTAPDPAAALGAAQPLAAAGAGSRVVRGEQRASQLRHKCRTGVGRLIQHPFQKVQTEMCCNGPLPTACLCRWVLVAISAGETARISLPHTSSLQLHAGRKRPCAGFCRSLPDAPTWLHVSRHCHVSRRSHARAAIRCSAGAVAGGGSVGGGLGQHPDGAPDREGLLWLGEMGSFG